MQWHAEGDADQVLDLLQDVKFIGEKRTAGFGQVHGWELMESDLDGITDATGQALRPASCCAGICMPYWTQGSWKSLKM